MTQTAQNLKEVIRDEHQLLERYEIIKIRVGMDFFELKSDDKLAFDGDFMYIYCSDSNLSIKRYIVNLNEVSLIVVYEEGTL